MGAFRLLSGPFSNTDQEYLLKTHFTGCQPISEEQVAVSASESINGGIDDCIFCGFGSYTTAGEDGIFPALLHHGIETLVAPLYKIFTTCLVFYYIPKAWQKFKIILIPKLRLESYKLAKSFRPISLTSFLMKTMEGLADLHIKERSLKDPPLNPYASCKSERQIE
jgi:hypothetical protein